MQVPFFSSRRSRRRRPSRRTALLVLCGALAVAVLWQPLLRATGAAASAAASKSALARVESHAKALRRAAAESGFDPNLLAGVAYAESKGKLSAVSQRDALGLFQLMLPTACERARELGLPEPTRADLLSDAQLNARLAANYLRWLHGTFDGDLEQMLIAYNAGPTKLRRWIDEAGDYASWRRERERAGSGLLRYVDEVIRHQAIFAERGRIQ